MRTDVEKKGENIMRTETDGFHSWCLVLNRVILLPMYVKRCGLEVDLRGQHQTCLLSDTCLSVMMAGSTVSSVRCGRTHEGVVLDTHTHKDAGVTAGEIRKNTSKTFVPSCAQCTACTQHAVTDEERAESDCGKFHYQATTLLRRAVIGVSTITEKSTWESATPETRSAVKTALFQVLDPEQNPKVARMFLRLAVCRAAPAFRVFLVCVVVFIRGLVLSFVWFSLVLLSVPRARRLGDSVICTSMRFC